MNISKKTIDLFKIVSRLNLSIMILPEDIEENGHRIYSKSVSGSSMCTAIIDEKIDKPFVTTDLSRFIKTIELFPQDSDYQFEDNYVTITSPSKNQKFKFYYSPKSLVECTQSNKLPKKQENISIDIPLSKDIIKKINDASSSLGVDDLKFYTEDGKVYVSILDKKNSTSNDFNIEIGDNEVDAENSFFFFKKFNIQLTNDDYVCRISDKGLAEFICRSGEYQELRYFVVSEAVAE